MNKIVSSAIALLIAACTFSLGIFSVWPSGPVRFAGSGQLKDAELLNMERNIIVSNNKLYKTEKVEIKINNRAGEKYTKISIPYSKMVHVSDIEAYIIDASGVKINTLKRSEITDKSAISDYSFYEDVYVKEFTLKNNTYPYTLYYSYKEQQDEFLSLDYWQPVIGQSIPTLQATLTLEIPSNYKISYTSRFISSFAADTSGTRIKYTWKTSYRDILPSELFSPSLTGLLPEVQIIPLEFKYDQPGSQKSWIELGNWYWKLISNLSDLPAVEQNKIRSIISDTDDKKEKIRKLYHYLQDAVRYVNISIKTGGLKPYPASYVAQNKYGDCKALSNYFRSVLEAAGIKSYYSLVNTESPVTPILKSFPSQQFDHVIICVPVGNDTLWLDCTSKLAFNYQGTFIQNRNALIIDENHSHFSRIPQLSPDEVTESRRIKVTPNNTGGILCSINYIFRGENYEAFAYLMHNYNENEKSRTVIDALAKGGLEVIDYTLIDPGRDSKEIHISCTGKCNKLFRQYGNDLLISLPPVEIPLFEEPSVRKLPVQIDYPINKTDTIEFTLPDGFNLSSMPKNKLVSNDYGMYFIEFTQNGRKITVIRKFLLNSGNYPLEKYGSLYNFIKDIIESEKTSLIVTSNKI